MIHVDAIAYTSKYKEFLPGTRISLTLVLLVASIFVDYWVLYMINLAVAFAIIFTFAKISVLTLAKLMMVPLVFTGVTALIIALDFTQGISIGRVIFALKVLLRSVSSFGLMFSLTLTIPMNQIINCMVKLRVPSAFIQLYALTYRMIFVIIELSTDMILSQQLRFGFIKPKRTIESIVQMSSLLFLRMLSRMDEMEVAMQTRFYNKVRSQR